MPPLPEFSSKKPLASKERFLLQTVNDFSVVLPKLSCFTHLTEPEASNQPWLSSSRCMTSVHSIWLQEMPSSVYRRCSMVNLTPSIRQMLILSFKNWNDENPGISRREKKKQNEKHDQKRLAKKNWKTECCQRIIWELKCCCNFSLAKLMQSCLVPKRDTPATDNHSSSAWQLWFDFSKGLKWIPVENFETINVQYANLLHDILNETPTWVVNKSVVQKFC